MVDFEDTDVAIELQERIEALQDELARLEDDFYTAQRALECKIDELEMEYNCYKDEYNEATGLGDFDE